MATGSAVNVVAAGSSNLSGGWTHLWASISGSMGGLLDLLTMVGVGCVVWAIAGWVWAKFRGNGGSSRAVVWGLAVGALLTMPNVVLPGVLKIADWIINIVTGAAGLG